MITSRAKARRDSRDSCDTLQSGQYERAYWAKWEASMKLTRMVIALSLGVGMLVGATSTGAVAGAATIDAQCGSTGQLTIRPGLTPVAQAQTISVSGSIDNVLGEACP